MDKSTIPAGDECVGKYNILGGSFENEPVCLDLTPPVVYTRRIKKLLSSDNAVIATISSSLLLVLIVLIVGGFIYHRIIRRTNRNETNSEDSPRIAPEYPETNRCIALVDEELDEGDGDYFDQSMPEIVPMLERVEGSTNRSYLRSPSEPNDESNNGKSQIVDPSPSTLQTGNAVYSDNCICDQAMEMETQDSGKRLIWNADSGNSSSSGSTFYSARCGSFEILEYGASIT